MVHLSQLRNSVDLLLVTKVHSLFLFLQFYLMSLFHNPIQDSQDIYSPCPLTLFLAMADSQTSLGFADLDSFEESWLAALGGLSQGDLPAVFRIVSRGQIWRRYLKHKLKCHFYHIVSRLHMIYITYHYFGEHLSCGSDNVSQVCTVQFLSQHPPPLYCSPLKKITLHGPHLGSVLLYSSSRGWSIFVIHMGDLLFFDVYLLELYITMNALVSAFYTLGCKPTSTTYLYWYFVHHCPLAVLSVGSLVALTHSHHWVCFFSFLFFVCVRRACTQQLSCARLFVNPRTAVYQDPLSMEFSSQKYWSGLLLTPPRAFLDPGIEPASPVSPALADGFFTAALSYFFGFTRNFVYFLPWS